MQATLVFAATAGEQQPPMPLVVRAPMWGITALWIASRSSPARVFVPSWMK
jgi:hypothetical protein